MKIQSVKRIKLNKIGTVAAVIILCFISFTAGVDLNQKANTASSASVLPVSKGGTGGNTASIAAANILGTNFENYSGILPLAKGGLGAAANTATGIETAQNNLKIPRVYTYAMNPDQVPKYIKIGETTTTYTNTNNSELSVFITGLARTRSSLNAIFNAFSLKTTAEDAQVVIKQATLTFLQSEGLLGSSNLVYAKICSSSSQMRAYGVYDGAGKITWWMQQAIYGTPTTLMFLNNGTTNPKTFTMETSATLPEGAIETQTICPVTETATPAPTDSSTS
ncbi:MAG: hypothetical protein LBB07_00830 [Bifidobacteriaceae bacterium]|jgi:hypothetical protein|nr:hypothetical protein [Bifidobacteriaceae bacterium]